jgi:hypothetical protein
MHPQPAAGGKPYRVGVIFVHGMGEQEQGDTVTEMGDALTEWLRKWLRDIPDARFKIREAKLRGGSQPVTGTPDHPIGGQAHVSVTISDGSKKPMPEQEWLLTESWWAKAFRQATFGELVAWAVSAGPWLIASQRMGLETRFRAAAAARPRGAFRRLLDIFAGAILTLLAALVAAVITPVFLALLIISIVPIPGLTDLTRGLVRNLTGSFGDLLILVRSPVRFAAMAEQVRTDIAWVARDCDRVMVLAHSQGSAVSWHAIRRMAELPEPDRSNVALFLSFGQAFRKLKSLYLVHQAPGGERVRFVALATASTALLLLAASQAVRIFGEIVTTRFDVGKVWDNAGVNVLLFLAALFGVFVLQEALSGLTRTTYDVAEGEIVKEITAVQGAMPGFHWVDLWASADPASNGPLLASPTPAVESYKIRNLANTLLDHSTYWSNVTEFVSAVAFAAASLAPASLIGTTELFPAALRDAAKVRSRRVSMLLAGRMLFLAALVVALWGVRSHLPGWGGAALSFVNSIPLLPDWFANWPPIVNGFAAAAIVIVIGSVGWLLLVKAWGIVIAIDEGAFFSRKQGSAGDGLAIGWTALAAAAPTAVMLALAINLDNWWVLVNYLVIGGLAVLIAVLALSQGGTTLDEAPMLLEG